MSENIEKAVQTEESSETKGTDNVVLYPVSDEEKTVSAAQETSDTESKATDGKTADNTNKFSDTQNTKESSPKDAEEEEEDVFGARWAFSRPSCCGPFWSAGRTCGRIGSKSGKENSNAQNL